MPYLRMAAPLLALLLPHPARSGDVVSDPQLGLRLTVPDGFAPAPDMVEGGLVYAFHRPAVGRTGTYLFVTRLRGFLTREKLDPKAVAAGNRATLLTEWWKGLAIDVMRVPEEGWGVRMVTYNAQVPLLPEAVQVGVAGDADREVEVRADLKAVLAGLDGESNWLPREERAGSARLPLAVGGLVVVAATAGVLAWTTFRPQRRGRPPVGGGPR